MISKQTAGLIYNCYAEIEAAEKMILHIKECINDKGEFELKSDNWNGTTVHTLELRIPSSGTGHFIRQLPMDVALTCIVSHIEKQKQKLKDLKTVCEAQLM